MNIQMLVTQYIAYRQALGEKFKTNSGVLFAFARAVGKDRYLSDVSKTEVAEFLDGSGPITHSWFIRYHALQGLYRYSIPRDYVESSALPIVLPKKPPSFIPYIYSSTELSKIIESTSCYQRNKSCMEPSTVRTFILTQYGAALRTSEVIGLNIADVDFEESVFTVRGTKFHKTRLVPFGPRLHDALSTYLSRKTAVGSQHSDGTMPFFTTLRGHRVNIATIEGCFRRVCEYAGVRRSDDITYQPRLHDLRHTACVHRLMSWYQEGRDVQRLLPHLSVYLGHAKLAATQTYLTMTPELLAEASERFEHYSGVDHV